MIISLARILPSFASGAPRTRRRLLSKAAKAPAARGRRRSITRIAGFAIDALGGSLHPWAMALALVLPGQRPVTEAPASPMDFWVDETSNAHFRHQDLVEGDLLETVTLSAAGNIHGIAISLMGKSYGFELKLFIR